MGGRSKGYAVTAYAFEHADELDIDPARILLLGHSAGGNLVASICIQAADTGAFCPAGILMEYFPADLHTDPAQKPGEIYGTPALYNTLYCPPELAKAPLVSPLFADERQLAAFPDTLIITAGRDSLSDENEEFALKLARAGVVVTLKRFRQSLHGFTVNRNGEWESALNLHHAFIAQHIQGQS